MYCSTKCCLLNVSSFICVAISRFSTFPFVCVYLLIDETFLFFNFSYIYYCFFRSHFGHIYRLSCFCAVPHGHRHCGSYRLCPHLGIGKRRQSRHICLAWYNFPTPRPNLQHTYAFGIIPIAESR